MALDTGGAEVARPWIERAEPEHPSLIDAAHVLDEMLGVVNVPTGVWIDEDGMIVRPPEPAFCRPSVLEKLEISNDLPERARDMLLEAKKIHHDPEGYLAALRDWVEHGAKSAFALSPDEVVARSRGRSPDEARAAACFELGQHLWREGDRDGAVPWLREAHRLQPDNWTYKRQCWEFVDPLMQGPSELFEGDWLTDVRRIGAENYYPALEF